MMHNLLLHSCKDFLIFSSNKPLEGMKFVIVGKTSKSKGDITKTVIELGGHIASKIGADTAACISTKGWYPIFFVGQNSTFSLLPFK